MKIRYSKVPKTNDSGKNKILTADFHFWVNHRHYVIRKGFVWDGASIPWVLQWKYGTPYDGVHFVGGLVHDAIYANAVIEIGYDRYGRERIALGALSRFEADNIYFALIRKNGAVFLRAAKEWLAVRFCGSSHWTKR